MEKLKEYIYIYIAVVRLKKKEKEEKEETIFLFRISIPRLQEVETSRSGASGGGKVWRRGKRRKFVSTVALNLAVAYEIFIILDMKVRPVNGGFPSTDPSSP